jgi:uncharacterized protein (DUF433 family)
MLSEAPILNLSKYIELRDNRPHIRGRRVSVATIAHSSQTHGWDVKMLCEQFTLSQNEVLSALLYYAENQSEIEAQEADYQRELDEAQKAFDEFNPRKRTLHDYRGVGLHVYDGKDAQEYINQLRDEWDG